MICKFDKISDKKSRFVTISPLVQMAAWIRLSTVVQWWRWDGEHRLMPVHFVANTPLHLGLISCICLTLFKTHSSNKSTSHKKGTDILIGNVSFFLSRCEQAYLSQIVHQFAPQSIFHSSRENSYRDTFNDRTISNEIHIFLKIIRRSS